MPRITKTLLSIALMSVVLGCSKTNPHPEDPLEGLNREIYGFNRAIDKGVVRPIAYSYRTYTPKPLQNFTHNFFNNFGQVTTVANDVLQGKVAYATHDIGRFLINSTIGIFGLFDPASYLGFEYREEDFGQTLYHWGVTKSAYFVIPFLGPSTFRDTFGMVVDSYLSLWPFIDSDERMAMLALDIVDTRASLLRNEKVLDAVGVDEYAFIRDAYLQRRNFQATDGKIVQDDLDELNDWEDEWDDFGEEETSSFEDEQTIEDDIIPEI